jgi:hypothetical protein
MAMRILTDPYNEFFPRPHDQAEINSMMNLLPEASRRFSSMKEEHRQALVGYASQLASMGNSRHTSTQRLANAAPEQAEHSPENMVIMAILTVLQSHNRTMGPFSDVDTKNVLSDETLSILVKQALPGIARGDKGHAEVRGR